MVLTRSIKTEKQFLEIASRYRTKSEFFKKEGKLYYKASRKGWLKNSPNYLPIHKENEYIFLKFEEGIAKEPNRGFIFKNIKYVPFTKEQILDQLKGREEPIPYEGNLRLLKINNKEKLDLILRRKRFLFCHWFEEKWLLDHMIQSEFIIFGTIQIGNKIFIVGEYEKVLKKYQIH